MNKKQEIQRLIFQEDKALRQKKYSLVLELKEKRLKLELEEVRDIKGEDKEGAKLKIFKPLNHSEIKPIAMQKVGLNYIPLIKGAYNVLVGRGGSGKSAVALQSLLYWLRDNPNKTGLAFFTEDGIEEIKTRAKIICQNSFLDLTLIDRIFFICLDNDDRIKWISSGKNDYNIQEEYIGEIVEFCKENNTEYIILDPLKRFHRLSENSNDDMDVLVRDCFTRLAVDTNAVLLVLHHSSKGVGGSRGATTITDSARIAYQIGRYFKTNQDGVIVINEDKKGKIKLDFLKDNLGLESLCKIRQDDNSIDNPLHDKLNAPVVVEFESDTTAYIPDI